jgi:5-methylthioadenosine/S-adenosylhomocysteine deaminase
MKSAHDDLIEGDGPNLDCELLKYGEIKGLIVGTTSILGQPMGSAKKCYGSLARSIDGQFNDLPVTSRPSPCTAKPSSDHILTDIAVPSGDALVDVNEKIASCDAWAYVVHVAEGIPGDKTAYNEWKKLIEIGLDIQQTAIIHGTALEKDDFLHMAEQGMKLIWSPRSNMFLYGQTTRLNLVMEVEKEENLRLTVALGPDWSMGGSTNLLEELNYASKLDHDLWGGVISPKRFVEMVTIDAARALEVQDFLGSIEKGKLADLFILSGDASKPYEALVHGRPEAIRLVMVNGIVLYGDQELIEAASIDGCENVTICGQDRFICIKEEESTNKLNQTFQDILDEITGALKDVDANDGTHFAPLADLVHCSD